MKGVIFILVHLQNLLTFYLWSEAIHMMLPNGLWCTFHKLKKWNKTEERIYPWYNGFYVSSLFFNTLSLKWNRISFMRVEMKLKNSSHRESCVVLNMFPIHLHNQKDVFWHCSQECGHHGWGYQGEHGPSQGKTTPTKEA